MKYLLLLLLVFACKKEDVKKTSCKTCEVNVIYKEDGQVEQRYLESSTDYCNGTPTEGSTTTSGTLQGKHWSKTKITSCH